MVYTDGIHLVADTVKELHQFAEKIQLKRCWFENHRHPHYDIIGEEKVDNALKNGAVLKTSREIVLLNLTNKRKPRRKIKSRLKV